MVLGYHVIFGAYGFWLPNDSRGSWSDFVRSWEMFRFGPATKVDTTRSVARAPHNRESRLEAKEALTYPPVQFTGAQARAVARGFAASATRSRVRVWACSILPEHVHLVIGQHTSKVESIVNCFKGDATKQLVEEGIHSFLEHRSVDGKVPRCFAQREWKVFLDSPEDILRAVQYVEENPVKEGKRRQSWQFVRPYDPLV